MIIKRQWPGLSSPDEDFDDGVQICRLKKILTPVSVLATASSVYWNTHVKLNDGGRISSSSSSSSNSTSGGKTSSSRRQIRAANSKCRWLDCQLQRRIAILRFGYPFLKLHFLQATLLINYTKLNNDLHTSFNEPPKVYSHYQTTFCCSSASFLKYQFLRLLTVTL